MIHWYHRHTVSRYWKDRTYGKRRTCAVRSYRTQTS